MGRLRRVVCYCRHITRRAVNLDARFAMRKGAARTVEALWKLIGKHIKTFALVAIRKLLRTCRQPAMTNIN